MSRDGLRTFSELLAETQHDDYAGDLSPVYATFTAEAANTRTQAELLAVAASNPNFVAYAMFTTNNQLQLFYLLTTVAVAIGPGASNLAGSTLAILGELGELTGPALVNIEESLFSRQVPGARPRVPARVPAMRHHARAERQTRYPLRPSASSSGLDRHFSLGSKEVIVPPSTLD